MSTHGLNRIDETVIFHSLDRDHIKQIILEAAGDNEIIVQHVLGWHRDLVYQEALGIASGMLNYIVDGKNTLPGWSLKFAAELSGAQGKTMTAVAKRLKVSKSAVSKAANRWADELKLPRSRYMKSGRAREVYSEERTKNHWRHQRHDSV